MNMLKPLLLCGALGLALTGPADAATLKMQSRINGDRILLGDLFDGLGVEADSVVAPAPAPGGQAVFDTASLSRIAQAFRLDWQPAGGDQRLTVQRSSTDIDASQVARLLQDALRKGGAPASIDVTVDNRALMVRLPSDVTGGVTVANLQYESGRGRITADLLAPGANGGTQRIPVTARAVDLVEVPVLVRPLRAGDTITDAEIAWNKVPRERLPANAITDVATLIGQTARRSLPAQQALRGSDIRLALVVAKGDAVTILLQTPLLTASAQGRALADGSAGETIRVMNIASSRVIDARVAGPNLVTVAAPQTTAPVPSHAAVRRTASN